MGWRERGSIMAMPAFAIDLEFPVAR